MRSFTLPSTTIHTPIKCAAKRHAPCSCLLAAAVLLALGQSSAHADEHRGGFTLQIASRVGSFLSIQFDGDNVLEPAITPLALSIGGFVTDRVALFGSASAAFFAYSPHKSASPESRLETNTTRSLFLGMTAQFWLSRTWAVGGGLGLSAIGHGPVEAEINRGVATPARVVWFFAEADTGSWGATFELIPSFYSRGETTLSSGVGIQWQWL